MHEIEFETYDQKNELIVDYISPVKVKAGETLIKKKDYKLRYVPRRKEYDLKVEFKKKFGKHIRRLLKILTACFDIPRAVKGLKL